VCVCVCVCACACILWSFACCLVVHHDLAQGRALEFSFVLSTDPNLWIALNLFVKVKLEKPSNATINIWHHQAWWFLLNMWIHELGWLPGAGFWQALVLSLSLIYLHCKLKDGWKALVVCHTLFCWCKRFLKSCFFVRWVARRKQRCPSLQHTHTAIQGYHNLWHYKRLPLMCHQIHLEPETHSLPLLSPKTVLSPDFSSRYLKLTGMCHTVIWDVRYD